MRQAAESRRLMALAACIPELIASGALPQSKADEAMRFYAPLQRRLAHQFGAGTAEAMATEATLTHLAATIALKKRQTLLQVDAQQKALTAMAAYQSPGGPGGPIDPRAAVALFDRDSRAGFSNVEGRRKAILGHSHAMIDRLLREHSRNLVGEIREKAQLRDIVAELFGSKSGNGHAAELAEGWTRAAEMLRQRFNAAGGDIGKLERWGLPQAHDARLVRKAGLDEWLAFTRPLLDRARLIDRDTGLAFDDAGLDGFLRDVWETIRTEGWAGRDAGAIAGTKLANQRQAHRYLHFDGPDAWTAYAERFGGGTAFDAMMGHIEAMSRDIALMEVLGPNPAATAQWLKDTVMKSAQLDTAPGTRAIEKAGAAGKAIDRLFAEITGAARQPESRRLALVFSSIRSVQTAAKLGSATLSAVTDLGFQWSARRFAGIPATAVLGDYLKLLNPASAEDRLLAVRLGLIADQWATMSSGTHRYLSEELTGEVSRRLAEGVLRVSGLSAWTQAGRWAFGMQMLGHLTDESVKRFEALDPAFRGLLQRYGIEAAEWDAIRATPLEVERGTPWLKPTGIADPALADRVLEMVLSETDFAVPVADLRTRATINSVAPRGTWVGEIARSAFLFKSFGIAVLLNQGRRIVEQASWGQKASVAIGFLIPATVMGALSQQLKEVGKGRDPRPMDDERFWGAAMLQGGGFGIFGDFLASQNNRFGGGFAQTLAGPLAQDADALFKALAADPEDRTWRTVRFLKSATPGSSLWYLRLGLDRMLADQLQAQIDPDYRQSWRRMERSAEEWGQEFWWAPGDAEPGRAPDFANAWEGEIPEPEEAP